MIEIHLRGRISEGKRSNFTEFLAEAIPYYESPGGIRVRVLWNALEPDEFVEIIAYDSQAIHDRDQLRVEEDERMRELLMRWRDLLDGPPRVETFTVAQ